MIYIGRCPSCRVHARLEAGDDGLVALLIHIEGEPRERQLDIAVAQRWSAGTIGRMPDGTAFYGPLRAGDSVWASGGLPMCIEHQTPLRFAKLKTRLTERPCDARCRRAASDKCECSCGGVNHGAAV